VQEALTGVVGDYPLEIQGVDPTLSTEVEALPHAAPGGLDGESAFLGQLRRRGLMYEATALGERNGEHGQRHERAFPEWP